MIPEQIPVKNHWGNNSATTFDFDFYIENEDQLKVTHTDFNGDKTVLTYGVDYSITAFKNLNGSSITFPLQGSSYDVLGWNTSTGEKELLSIALDLPVEQPAEYDMSGDLNKKNLEKSLDYLTRIDQIQDRRLSRMMSYPEGSGVTNADLPMPVANNVFKWNDDCTGIENYDINAVVETQNSSISSIQSTANTALTNSQSAVSTANSAETKANNAVSTANTANTNASSAVSTANTASNNASTALTTANTALSNSQSAVTTANTASSTATAASDKVDDLEETIQVVIDAAEQIEELQQAIEETQQAAEDAAAAAAQAESAAAELVIDQTFDGTSTHAQSGVAIAGAGFLSGITSTLVVNALGYTPYNGTTNPDNYISGITSSDVLTALGYTPYNSTNPNGYISGITSTDVTNALGYTPVNKAGGTLTGTLNYVRTDVTKGTNPDVIKYWEWRNLDNNPNPAEWYANRMGAFQTALYPDGTVETLIKAFRNDPTVSTAADIKLSITSSGVKSCEFPNTTCCDGQWVALERRMTTSTAIGQYDIDLSQYLPNDGQKYDVLFNGEVYNSGSTYSHLYLGSSETPYAYVACVGTNAREATINQLITIGTDRTLTLRITTNSCTWNTHEGRSGLYMLAYKRKGTNA